jgi:peptidoglycan/LPS O-acetylase OafA/YrhL
MKYRSDIEGLRALAVLPVVGFHLGSSYAPGGFVGVDIFFVISGFLITKIILDQINDGAYRITDFYNRRIRRLAPALFVVFAFCLLSTVALRLSSLLVATGNSIAASLFFVSNIFFYEAYGYFDQAAGLNPVLHTWSLSVEEQFYIFFPLIIFAVKGTSATTKRAIFALAFGASLGCSAYLVKTDPNAAFFLVQSRAWELLVGTLLATGALPLLSNNRLAELIGVIGLSTVVASVLLLNQYLPFPGLTALAPCLGAAAIIYSGASCATLVGRLLSLPIPRFIGKISYSLYLWHWPIIVFYKYFREPAPLDKFIILFGCIALATLTWRYVETPFRTKPFRLNAAQTLAASGAVMFSAALALVVGGPQLSIEPSRLDKLVSYAARDWGSSMRDGKCFLTSHSDNLSLYDRAVCLTVDTRKMNVLVLGDSHAADLWFGLQFAFPDIHFLQATASGCKPLLEASGLARCTDLMDLVFKQFLPNNRIDAIIVSARWALNEVNDAHKTAVFLARFTDRMILVGPIPEYRRSLPLILAQSSPGSEGPYSDKFRSLGNSDVDLKFRSEFGKDNVTYISLQKILCRDVCKVMTNSGEPLQFDYGHLTTAGSVYVAPLIFSR